LKKLATNLTFKTPALTLRNSECEISSSHGGEYEAQNLMGCTAVFLIEFRPDFGDDHRPDDGGSTYL
jgi:hypothetical protein